MSAKVEITLNTLFSIIHEVNLGNKTLDDYAQELDVSKRTLQRKLQDNGFLAYRGYNVWSKPNETKEEVLAIYRSNSLETSSDSTKPQEVIKHQQPKKQQSKSIKKPIVRSDEVEKTKRLNIELKHSTFVKLKVHSVQMDTSMTDIVTTLIERYLIDK